MAFQADQLCENIKQDYDWEQLFGVKIDQVDFEVVSDSGRDSENEEDFYYTVWVDRNNKDSTVLEKIQRFLADEFKDTDIRVLESPEE